MVAPGIRPVAGRCGGGASNARRQKQHRPDTPAGQTPRDLWKRTAQAVFPLSLAHAPVRPSSVALQMSTLLDTDLLSLLERKRVPPKLAAWLQHNDSDLFVSIVSLAELEY